MIVHPLVVANELERSMTWPYWLGCLCQLLLAVIARPLVATNGLERTGHDFKPSRSLVLKVGLILSALKTRAKDNDGTEPTCRFSSGYWGVVWSRWLVQL